MASMFPSPTIRRRKTLSKGPWSLSGRQIQVPTFRRRGSSLPATTSSCGDIDQHRDDIATDRRDRRVRFDEELPCVVIPDLHDSPSSDEIQSNWFHVSRISKVVHARQHSLPVTFSNLTFVSSLSTTLTYTFAQFTDFCRFEKDRILTVAEFMASRRRGSMARFDNVNHTARGLESLTCDNGLKKRRINEKQDLMKAMKEETKRQSESAQRKPDLDRYAAISQRYTKAAKERALYLGLSDARECRPKESNNHIVNAISRQTQRMSLTLRRRGSGVYTVGKRA